MGGYVERDGWLCGEGWVDKLRGIGDKVEGRVAMWKGMGG
jgi:hypothetical protein